MSPPKPSFTTNNDDIQHHNPTRKLTTHQRPSPLKINRESQAINKLRREPVIIYTHSPKIIHTQARDFMALVQRLTGLSREHIDSDRNESSSVLTDDCKFMSSTKAGHRSGGSFFSDIPLFTPSGMELNMFCSPRPVVNVGSSSLSPSVLEFMKGLPEY